MHENAHAEGHYEITCIGPDGKRKWTSQFDNVVTTVGRNIALDAYLDGSAYTVTGPFLGLIAGAGFSAVSAADTMTVHSGWAEFTAYSGSRATITWSAATGASKTANAASFSITGSGVVQGAFLVFGAGALNTISNTGGCLYSAGVGPTTPTVTSGDTVTVIYVASM